MRFGSPWRLLAPPAAIWRYLALRATWRVLAPPGASWRLVVLSGVSRRFLALPGASWRLLAPPGQQQFQRPIPVEVVGLRWNVDVAIVAAGCALELWRGNCGQWVCVGTLMLQLWPLGVPWNFDVAVVAAGCALEL